MKLENVLEEYSLAMFDKSIAQLDDRECYVMLLNYVKKQLDQAPHVEGKKKLYYISAEFLIGKLLSNNLINLKIYHDVKEILEKNGKSLSAIEEIELEPSLGNGGLGRLAACFMDSITTLDLPADGVGLNYHLGLFLQKFENNEQKEYPNPWMSENSWLNKTDVTFEVPFKDITLPSRLYEIAVSGYNGKVNTLKLFDLDSVDETIVESGIGFDKKDIKKNLTLFLYPDDSDDDGRKLRIYQQYFLVSSAAQMILADLKAKNIDLHDLHKYVVIQINDTHPSMVIPELIRLLCQEGLDFNEAAAEVEKTTAYTNHTILAEALETWPMSYLEEIVPQLVPIIKQLDALAKTRSKEEATFIIDKENRVHMASMDIHFSQSTNGVAAIHTDILKNEELHSFYELYPEKFNNKTNGITFRRWLFEANPELTAFLDEKIGTDYKKDALDLQALLQYKEDEKTLKQLLDIKAIKKRQLAKYLKETQNIEIDEHSIYDIQIKRLHEYKRQQMNALYIIDQYLKIKEGIVPERPITCIFGAKAAPAYILAKDIIHVILTLQQLIESDPLVRKHLRVVMVENYNVTKAEKLIPAADVSEQISLASKEASGTSNMKFMLNGAVTLGTDDGANVEIHELVGNDNIYIFGAKADEVIDHYKHQSYHSREYYENDERIRKVVDFITSEEMMKLGNPSLLQAVHDDLINKDWFMTLLDFEAYVDEKQKIFAAYEDRMAWAKKMLVNIAQAGYFSSDRTIAQYNEEIWHLK
ncbi:glycogen/starch/alpha-glucan phosphorylase [Firmicutes bacterium M10-2]|nr:glycogen/starch/alpha-glucan phosphorylase [Firmicutes bacterium M10-2]